MPILINAYCTHRSPPEPGFRYELNSRRDLSDPELGQHLEGFMDYVMSRGDGKMTQSRFHLLQHIQRVRHQLSMTVEDDQLDAFAAWAWEANAICFLPDGSIRNPSGEILIDANGEPEQSDAEMPYPRDALERKARSEELLGKKGIPVLAALPPVIGEHEVELRAPGNVARRALALFVVALRAESLNSDSQIAPEELRTRFPEAFDALSPAEIAFFQNPAPERQQIVDAGWRYEALLVLQWALGLAEELAFPAAICDVPAAAKRMFERQDAAWIRAAQLRPAREILDALDVHFRLHWAVRQARVSNKNAPAGIEPGVVAERHYALNWLVRFGNAHWDDVDTPT